MLAWLDYWSQIEQIKLKNDLEKKNYPLLESEEGFHSETE